MAPEPKGIQEETNELVKEMHQALVGNLKTGAVGLIARMLTVEERLEHHSTRIHDTANALQAVIKDEYIKKTKSFEDEMARLQKALDEAIEQHAENKQWWSRFVTDKGIGNFITAVVLAVSGYFIAMFDYHNRK